MHILSPDGTWLCLKIEESEVLHLRRKVINLTLASSHASGGSLVQCDHLKLKMIFTLTSCSFCGSTPNLKLEVFSFRDLQLLNG